MTSHLSLEDEGDVSERAFDVYPENDNASFEGGTWSNYPFFHQKKIVAVSSIDRGLFILRLRAASAPIRGFARNSPSKPLTATTSLLKNG